MQALFKNILDEPTASLDPKSELSILINLLKLLK